MTQKTKPSTMPVRIKRKISIFRCVVLPFLAVAILDCLLLLALLFVGGTFARMHESGLTILSEVTLNKHSQLEASMLSWSSIDPLGEQLCEAIELTLGQRRQSAEDMASDPELNAALVDACKDILMDELMVKSESGVFMVLNGIGVPGKADSYAGVYLYDSVPDNYHSDHSDISLLRGLPPLSRSLNITLHSFWQASFSFPGDEENERNDYFYRPFNAYNHREKKNASAKYYGYWCPAFHLDDMDGEKIITYSRALVSGTGEIYGVYGVSITMNHLRSVINTNIQDASEDEDSFYLGVTLDGGKSYQCVTTVGRSFTQNFDENRTLRPRETIEHSVGTFAVVDGDRTSDTFYGAIYPLHLYSANTPFLNMEWRLIGLRNETVVFRMEKEFQRTIAVVIAIGIVLGMLIALWSAAGISSPISRLVMELRSLKGIEMRKLQPTGINEVDELASTIMKLSDDAVEEASRISKIITLSGLPFGAFQHYNGNGQVFCSDGFFRLLGCEEPKDGSNRLTADAFERILQENLKELPAEGNDIYEVCGSDPVRYIRMRRLEDANGLIGTLLDVTDEMEKRHRIERERDYDLLSGLLNRRAFEARTKALMEQPEENLMPVSALVMIDLDNLKAVNDSYGHDSGDLYIQSFAKVLSEMSGERCLVGRRSGDEFFMFCYGYPGKDEIRELLRMTREEVQRRTVLLGDNVHYRLRASAGVAWYPDDSADFDSLLRYADFAMYCVKNTTKGAIKEFDHQEYNAEGYMVNGIQALNRMLEHNLVRYAFQPIVSAEDGSVFAYEMLMRPDVEELPNPFVVLKLAREQGRLEQVESMTFRRCFQTAQALKESGALNDRVKLFINTIANQLIPKDEELFARYSDLLRQVVVEFTEYENATDEKLTRKIGLLRKHDAKVAIDDFGSGYNGDLSLIAIDTDYVKIDMSFVRDVHLDPNKRALIANTVQYAHQRGIKIIGEGVENGMEMDTLSMLGVDYFQGYYLARPGFMPQGIPERVVEEIQAANRRYRKG